MFVSPMWTFARKHHLPQHERICRTRPNIALCTRSRILCRSVEHLEKSLDERKSLLKQFGLCFRCWMTTDHFAKDCKVIVTCEDYGSGKHATALHLGSPHAVSPDSKQSDKSDKLNCEPQLPEVSSTCTEVCGSGYAGRSCSKICLVDVSHASQSQRKVGMYAILDDPSNKSLART